MSLKTQPLSERRQDRSQAVFHTKSTTLAEWIRMVLAIFEIRAGVLDRDPCRVGVAMVDVIVLSHDHERAQLAFDAATFCHTEDWVCSDCEEFVPKTFDYCWNCGSLHPEFVADEPCTTSDLMEEVPLITAVV